MPARGGATSSPLVGNLVIFMMFCILLCLTGSIFCCFQKYSCSYSDLEWACRMVVASTAQQPWVGGETLCLRVSGKIYTLNGSNGSDCSNLLYYRFNMAQSIFSWIFGCSSSRRTNVSSRGQEFLLLSLQLWFPFLKECQVKS